MRFAHRGSWRPAFRAAEIIERDAENLGFVGEIVGDASREFRMVTLGFLADGGDGFPFPEGDSANRVDLSDDVTATGDATFAPDGTEQDALAEYLDDNFTAETPFNEAETARSEDTRIQNLAFREDSVIDGDGGGDEPVVIQGTARADNITGTDANEIIFGGDIRDRLNGAGGNDQLFGEGGRDVLNGGAGDDLLNGGGLNNLLTGGSGSDTFVLEIGGDSRILDFAVGEDLIGLSEGLSFGQLSITKRGKNALISDGDSIVGRVMNTDVNALTESMFVEV